MIFPVIEARVRYKFPARYDDLLTIEVWVTAIEKVRLNFGHRILNQNGKLILEAETFHVCTSREEKPKRLPEELAEKLKPYLNPVILNDARSVRTCMNNWLQLGFVGLGNYGAL